MTYDNYRLQDCCLCSRLPNPENALPLMMAVAVSSLISDSAASRQGRFLKEVSQVVGAFLRDRLCELLRKWHVGRHHFNSLIYHYVIMYYNTIYSCLLYYTIIQHTIL